MPIIVFFNPIDSTATQQTLTLPLASAIFPFSNLGTPSITGMTMIVALLDTHEPGPRRAHGKRSRDRRHIWADRQQCDTAAVKLQPVTGTAAGGTAIAALVQWRRRPGGTAGARAFTLTIPQASLPAMLANIGERTGAARSQPDRRYRSPDQLHDRVTEELW